MDKKIIKIETVERDMGVLLPDGTRLPTKGKIVTTYYADGKNSVKVIIEKPLSLNALLKKEN